MASQMELISCHEPTAGSFSVTFLLKNVRHMLSFCLECIKNIEYRFCEGTTQVGYDPEGPCTHLTPPYSSIDTVSPVGTRIVSGRPAVNMMRDKVLPLAQPFTHSHSTVLRELIRLFNPVETIVQIQHAETCIYGSRPAAIIQGHGKIYENMYFKRCNGEYINAVGKEIDNGPRARGMNTAELSTFEALVRAEALGEEVIADASWRMRTYLQDTFPALTRKISSEM